MADLLKDKTQLLEELKKWHSEQKKSQNTFDEENLLGEEGISLHQKLKIAIMMNHINDVTALLEIGAEAKGLEGDELTPLQLALVHDRQDIARLIASYLDSHQKPKPKTKG